MCIRDRYTLNDLIGGLTITFDDDHTEIHSTFTKGSTVTLNRWYMDKFITYRSETDLEGAYKRGMRSMAVMKALFNQYKGKSVADPAVALEYYNGLKDYICLLYTSQVFFRLHSVSSLTQETMFSNTARTVE